MSRAPLVPAALLLAAGVFLGIQRPVQNLDGPFAFLVAASGMVVAASAMVGLRVRAEAAFAIVGLAGVCLGLAARMEADGRCPARVPPDAAVLLEGVVESSAGGRLRIRLASVALDGVVLRCSDTVLARWSGEGPAAGDRIAGEGRWWMPSAGGGLSPVVVVMLDSVRTVEGSAGGSRLAGIRGRAAARLEALYGPRAGLATSLLLAQRDGLDPEVRDRFARAGLSHLLAISGLHVGLVAGLLLLLGKLVRLRKLWAAALAAAGTVGYVLFLGAPAAASRAAFQVVLFLLAGTVQRPARSEAVVAAAAILLLALEPLSLTMPGFQLSFAGVAGLLAFRRPFLARLRFLEKLRVRGLSPGKWLADGLATGTAATLATAPIVAWHFGQVALIGVAANLVAIPIVGALVPTLALSLFAHVLWEGAGEFVADGGAALLAALDATGRLAASVPGGSFGVLPSTSAVVTAASVVAWAGSRRLGSVRPPVRLAMAGGLAVLVLTAAGFRISVDHVEVHMIDVGQGDAIALRSPGGRWLLVDAGVAGRGYDAGERTVVPYLAARGARRLEGLILTHPDADHIGGAPAVVRALRPRWIGDPGLSVGKPGYLELLEAAASTGSPWIALRDGVEVHLDGMTVEFLHPWPGAENVEDANDASVILRVVYGAFSVLLTGDAPSSVEEELVRRRGKALESDVLKAGHHGSNTSTSSALLRATDARVALISAGRGNRYGHPHGAVLARLDSAGMTVLRTDRQGSVVIRGRGEGRVIVVTRDEGGSQ